MPEACALSSRSPCLFPLKGLPRNSYCGRSFPRDESVVTNPTRRGGNMSNMSVDSMNHCLVSFGMSIAVESQSCTAYSQAVSSESYASSASSRLFCSCRHFLNKGLTGTSRGWRGFGRGSTSAYPGFAPISRTAPRGKECTSFTLWPLLGGSAEVRDAVPTGSVSQDCCDWWFVSPVSKNLPQPSLKSRMKTRLCMQGLRHTLGDELRSI